MNSHPQFRFDLDPAKRHAKDIKVCSGSPGEADSGPPTKKQKKQADRPLVDSFVEHCLQQSELCPRCPRCSGPARPAILLFDDNTYVVRAIFGSAKEKYEAWHKHVVTSMRRNPDCKLVVLEFGCGIGVPTVRNETESFLAEFADQCSLVRVNPTALVGDNGRDGLIHIKMNADEAIACIDQHLNKSNI